MLTAVLCLWKKSSSQRGYALSSRYIWREKAGVLWFETGPIWNRPALLFWVWATYHNLIGTFFSLPLCSTGSRWLPDFIFKLVNSLLLNRVANKCDLEKGANTLVYRRMTKNEHEVQLTWRVALNPQLGQSLSASRSHSFSHGVVWPAKKKKKAKDGSVFTTKPFLTKQPMFCQPLVNVKMWKPQIKQAFRFFDINTNNRLGNATYRGNWT